ncbi:flap endonuclease-1 [Candidatus Pacearchaeota archaeon]|nr:flap endonuclease-1 [Candidatus Pacearchaeota archaeon]
MGLQIGDIVPRRALEMSELSGKIICIDAFNILFQFITTIRQPDGTPLMDRQGRVTSHLSGLFYRNINLLIEGIKPVYVFDGTPPEQKQRTHESRKERKLEAEHRYAEAKQKEDVEAMAKYAKQFSYLTSEIIEESKELLNAMGIPTIDAPGEGEAQAAFISQSKAFAVGSQDYDALLFGAPRLIQNLTLARKRKTVSGYVYISPEIIELEKVLNHLQINQDQLICLGILIGTDYNPKGIYGIGPRKALDIVRKMKQPTLIFKSVEDRLKEQEEQFDWQEIFELFKKPNIEKDIKIEFHGIDNKKIKQLLVSRDFSEERIDNGLKKLEDGRKKVQQSDLKKWF